MNVNDDININKNINVKIKIKMKTWMILKRKNVTVNKRRIKITSRCESMLYLWKNNLKKAF